METRKRRVEFFSIYNHTGIEAHLTQMAKKGWMIESITNVCWTYRRIEPKNIHFCVSYYPRASDFDPGPTEEQQTFHDFCAHTGWKLACTWFQMQVFYNENTSPIPLDTDPVMEVDTLHRACKKNFLPSYFVLLAASFLFSCYFFAGICLAPIAMLSNPSQLVTLFAYFCLFLICAVELATYLRWHRKAKLAAQDGIFVDTPSTVKFQKAILAVLLISAAYWLVNLFAADDPVLAWVAAAMLVGMFGVIFAVNAIKQGLKKAKVSKGMNLFLTLTACFILPPALTVGIIYGGIALSDSSPVEDAFEDHTKIPFSVSDFRDVDGAFYVETNDHNQTFFLSRMDVDLFPHWDEGDASGLPELRYEIVTVKIPGLYNWCKEEMYHDRDETKTDVPVGYRNLYKHIDSGPWGAKDAYRLYCEEGWWHNTYLICYEDKILEITFDWEPSADDMATINQKMN